MRDPPIVCKHKRRLAEELTKWKFTVGFKTGVSDEQDRYHVGHFIRQKKIGAPKCELCFWAWKAQGHSRFCFTGNERQSGRDGFR